MKVYLLMGAAQENGETTRTYIYGIFDDKNVAEMHRDTIQKRLEEDDCAEVVTLEEMNMNEPTLAYWDTLQG